MEGQIGQVGTSREKYITERDRKTRKADWLFCLKSERPEQLKKCVKTLGREHIEMDDQAWQLGRIRLAAKSIRLA